MQILQGFPWCLRFNFVLVYHVEISIFYYILRFYVWIRASRGFWKCDHQSFWVDQCCLNSSFHLSSMFSIPRKEAHRNQGPPQTTRLDSNSALYYWFTSINYFWASTPQVHGPSIRILAANKWSQSITYQSYRIAYNFIRFVYEIYSKYD